MKKTFARMLTFVLVLSMFAGCADRTFFNKNGASSDLTVAPMTKNELGTNYGMGKISPIGKEWNEQAAALANYAVGKTVDELKNGALNESGKAKDADLATSATIYLGGYVSGIEAAVANAQFLGATAGDELKRAIIPGIGSSTAATAEKDGTAQLDMDVAVVTMNGDVITSCYIDSLQAKVNFNAAGEITTDLTAPVLTKNELGTAYGMGKFSPIGKEWNEQAAAFASYVTGKTSQAFPSPKVSPMMWICHPALPFTSAASII